MELYGKAEELNESIATKHQIEKCGKIHVFSVIVNTYNIELRSQCRNAENITNKIHAVCLTSTIPMENLVRCTSIFLFFYDAAAFTSNCCHFLL